VTLTAWIAAALVALLSPTAFAEDQTMARRQQGILTGMPFMANLAQRTFVDDLGRKVFLAKPPTRVVSLAPSVTEMLFAIGAGEQVIAVTPFCDYPPEAAQKPKIGYTRPSLESLIALHPDLIVAPHEFIRSDLLSKLEEAKVPVFILDAKVIEDIASHLQTLGRMLGRTSDGDRVATALRQRLAELRARTEALSRPRLLYVLNSEPLITVGSGTFLSQLLELAGAANIGADASLPYPRLSMEQVLAKDPELILFPVGQAEGIPEHEQAQWRRWSTISAVRNGRLAHIEGDVINRPGPRIALGLERLIDVIHPNAEPAR